MPNDVAGEVGDFNVAGVTADDASAALLPLHPAKSVVLDGRRRGAFSSATLMRMLRRPVGSSSEELDQEPLDAVRVRPV